MSIGCLIRRREDKQKKYALDFGRFFFVGDGCGAGESSGGGCECHEA